MKYVEINPSPLKGDVKIPPSKSMSHRAIICAALSEGESLIENIAFSDDIIATLEAMKSFGITAKNSEADENGICTVHIQGKGKLNLLNDEIDCKESGSTIRFLIPMAGLLGDKVTYTGRGKLVERPLDTYYKIFEEQNIAYSNNEGKLPLSIEGILKPGIFKMKGNISSQFITGLLFVLPLLKGDSKIIITTELESKGYVDLTLDMLKQFDIEIENNNYEEFIIKGNQKYKANNHRVEGDFSQAAFFIVAGILGKALKCEDLNIASLQGDKAILDIVGKMGADIAIHNDFVKVNESTTKGMIIDASQCPDLVPILAVLGSLSKGTTKIVNAARLRIKESDRLKAMATELSKLGADIKELEDGLEIHGREKLKGGVVDSWNDHRIAMALAIASIKCSEPVIIQNSDAVKKSYPRFWQDFEKLGGQINERYMGK
ncbi:MAG: 3-phosphoshikimate 1-carboxyvinyltransferase [Marinisporobacter sp.]|nr:3-phosphoshikimate 1-carboxyvinyltransferase [Marinisporobacter sp.]